MEENKEELYRRYMQECIEIGAKKGNSNYRDGCIIFDRAGVKISEGWRHFDGRIDMHAERHAIQRASEGIRGGILVTTSEPCTSRRYADKNKVRKLFKSCCDLIIENGIKLVIKPNYKLYGSKSSLEERSISVICLNDFESVIKYELRG